MCTNEWALPTLYFLWIPEYLRWDFPTLALVTLLLDAHVHVCVCVNAHLCGHTCAEDGIMLPAHSPDSHGHCLSTSLKGGLGEFAGCTHNITSPKLCPSTCMASVSLSLSQMILMGRKGLMCEARGSLSSHNWTLVKQRSCPELPKARAHNLFHSTESCPWQRPNVQAKCFHRADSLSLYPKCATFMQPSWRKRLRVCLWGCSLRTFCWKWNLPSAELRCRILSLMQ